MEINLFFKQIPLSAFAAPAPLHGATSGKLVPFISNTVSTFLQQHSLFCTNKSTYVQHLSWQGDTGCIYKLTITNIRITENLIWARLYCTCPLLLMDGACHERFDPNLFFFSRTLLDLISFVLNFDFVLKFEFKRKFFKSCTPQSQDFAVSIKTHCGVRAASSHS